MLRANGHFRLYPASVSRVTDFANGLLASQCNPAFIRVRATNGNRLFRRFAAVKQECR
jgi:hypothetical protein